MLQKPIYSILLKYIVLLACVVWLVYFMLKNEVPTDVGDGIMHFFYSQASWEQTELFLHHWGKPFFILVSSPFAQFGFNGIVVFNILVFTSTVLIGFNILQKFGVSVWIQLLFPLILLIPHDVTDTIFGGLTEPLFNLATIGSLYLLLEKKYLWFAILVSLMPFMRSEGQLPVVLALMLLVYNKSYKYIPFLFFGFIVYSVVGIFVYNDFWWYFTKSAYSMDNDIYGKGTWSHYLLSYKNYLGNPAVYILILGIPSMLVLAFKKRWKDLQLEWAFYAYGIFTGVLVLHSYFWATGQNGSLGLTRIATQGMPIFVLLHLYYISRFALFNHIIAKVVYGVFALIMAITLITTKIYPQKLTPFDKQVVGAAKYLEFFKEKENKIYFHFPLFVFAYGENPFSADRQCVFHTSADLGREIKTLFKPGDLIIRDSHFGPAEANLPLVEINKYPELVKVREFISSEQVDDKYGEIESVIIYQYIPLEKQKPIIISSKKLLEKKEFLIKGKEFTDLHTLLPPLNEDTKVTFSLSSTNDEFVLVYVYNQTEDYSNMKLNASQAINPTFLFRKAGNTKLYIWNPNKKTGKITLTDLRIEEINYPQMMD